MMAAFAGIEKLAADESRELPNSVDNDEAVAIVSIAISLRRIADVLERVHYQGMLHVRSHQDG